MDQSKDGATGSDRQYRQAATGARIRTCGPESPTRTKSMLSSSLPERDRGGVLTITSAARTPISHLSGGGPDIQAMNYARQSWLFSTTRALTWRVVARANSWSKDYASASAPDNVPGLWIFASTLSGLEARGFEPLTSSLQSWRSTN